MACLRIVNAERVRSVLTWPLVNESVEEALKAVSCVVTNDPTAPYATQVPRLITSFGDDRSKALLTMPCYVGNYELEDRRDGNNTPSMPVAKIKYSTLACKLVTSFSGNMQRQPPVPRIQANIALFSTETGELEYIMDGTEITAWRTAAASIAATKYIYLRRYPDFATRPIQVGIVGCGVQGRSHALGMCDTFNVSVIRLWNRTVDKAEALAELLRKSGTTKTCVHVMQTAAEAISDADVICIGTFSPTALINAAMLTKSDVHINAVGAGQVHFGEVAQDIYDKALVYVDSLASAKMELRELKAKFAGEIGSVIARTHNPEGQKIKHFIPPPQQGITIFQSMGVAAEDAIVAQAVVEELKRAADESR